MDIRHPKMQQHHISFFFGSCSAAGGPRFGCATVPSVRWLVLGEACGKTCQFAVASGAQGGGGLLVLVYGVCVVC